MDPRRLDPDVPDPVENRRSSSGQAVRLVYLLGLLGLALFLAWHFLRFMVFLEGSGTITAKQFMISAPMAIESTAQQGNHAVETLPTTGS